LIPRFRLKLFSYNKIYVLPIKNSLNQGDALLLLLFNFALEYVPRNVQETNLGLDMDDVIRCLLMWLM
jgi:hypothetical protein